MKEINESECLRRQSSESHGIVFAGVDEEEVEEDETLEIESIADFFTHKLQEVGCTLER